MATVTANDIHDEHTVKRSFYPNENALFTKTLKPLRLNP